MNRAAQSVFLSRVSVDFGYGDNAIEEDLSVQCDSFRTDHQTRFRDQQAGSGLLSKLLQRLRSCDVVIHYVGRTLGERPEPVELEELFGVEADVARWLNEQSLDFASWTYVQWEAYLAVYMRLRESLPERKISLIGFHVLVGDEVATNAVSKHFERLKKWQDAQLLRLPVISDGDADTLALHLVRAFRKSTIVWPSVALDGIDDRGQKAIVDLLQQCVELGRLECSEILALAFRLCQDVIHLEGSDREAGNFIARIVAKLKAHSAKGGPSAVYVHAFAVMRLLVARDTSLSSQLERLIESVAARSGRVLEAVENVYRTTFPDCFPRYPLPLCTEIFIWRLAEKDYRATVTYRVGDCRKLVDMTGWEIDDSGLVGEPNRVVVLALLITTGQTAALGGVERVELMVDERLLANDDDWRWLASGWWQEVVENLAEVEPDPVVLRWAHTDASARELTQAAPNACVRFESGYSACGITVLHAAGGRDDSMSHDSMSPDSMNHWKEALKRSSLTIWGRRSQPLPTDARDFPWQAAARHVRQRQWRDIGIALNPPEAPVYKPCQQFVLQRNLRILKQLGPG